MRQGFSLVELSIVLVILGLLTGGILTGQNLIRAAELRSITTEYANYSTAANTFRDKYFAIPGDFRDATRFWGRQVNAAHCATNSATAVSATGVCDGNGDGQIGQAPAASESGERYQLWKHLASAGLIEGSYTGLAGASGILDHQLRVNTPAGKISPGGWSPLYRGTSIGLAGSWFAGDYGNELAYMGWTSAGGTTAVIKPEEAWNIDTKVDDGKPGRGKVLAYIISTCTDAGGGAGSQLLLDSNYLLTSSNNACGLFFLRVF